MPHVSGDQFTKLAKKRLESLPHSGEFQISPPSPRQSESEPVEQIREKVEEHRPPVQNTQDHESITGYGHSHRNGYQHEPEIAEPHLSLPKTAQEQIHPPQVHTHEMTRGEKINFVVIRTIGNFLLFFSLYGVCATFGPALYFEGQYRIAQARGVEYTVHTPATVAARATGSATPSQPVPTIEPVSPGFGSILADSSKQVLVPPDTEFSVVIPKIGATSKIYPNVDPLNENEFLTKLQTGVAHAKGTVFPGMQGNTYLFAHSTDNFWNVGRYNAVFYLLKELKPGDDVIIFFEGKRYNYTVDRTEIRDASDVEFLVESQKPGKEQLIMQTCWPPGTTWKRLYVIATPR